MTATGLVFDLDDTLYKERDFVKSGQMAVALRLQQWFGEPAFLTDALAEPGKAYDLMLQRCGAIPEAREINIDTLLDIYRSHKPDIDLTPETKSVLSLLASDPHITLGLITDGRTLTQRNKINALKLTDFIPQRNILISGETGADKYSDIPFRKMMELNPGVTDWIYVGDNPVKDFLWPNRIWHLSVMLRDTAGYNIHSQNPEGLTAEHMPRVIIDSLAELPALIAALQSRNEINTNDNNTL